jgi:hypothetical protein
MIVRRKLPKKTGAGLSIMAMMATATTSEINESPINLAVVFLARRSCIRLLPLSRGPSQSVVPSALAHRFP